MLAKPNYTSVIKASGLGGRGRIVEVPSPDVSLLAAGDMDDWLLGHGDPAYMEGIEDATTHHVISTVELSLAGVITLNQR